MIQKRLQRKFMNYDLSIIIAHFIPEKFQGKNPLIKTSRKNVLR